MMNLTTRLLLLVALVIGAAAVCPTSVDAGPLKAKIAQHKLAKPAKKPKAPPPPKRHKGRQEKQREKDHPIVCDDC